MGTTEANEEFADGSKLTAIEGANQRYPKSSRVTSRTREVVTYKKLVIHRENEVHPAGFEPATSGSVGQKTNRNKTGVSHLRAKTFVKVVEQSTSLQQL